MGEKRSQEGSQNRQLRGWKEIALSLGKDESTVKRWALDRGLPIHRVPGQKRASVYAWTDEINDWLTSRRREGGLQASLSTEPLGLAEFSLPGAKPGPQPRIWSARATAGGIILAALAMFGAASLMFRPAPDAAPSAYRSSDLVQDLYLEGVYLYRKRSPETLDQAADRFRRAIMLDPAFAPARASLAVTYNLMVEYGLIGAEAGYAQAGKEAQAALRINPQSPEALAVLGDIAFFQAKQYEKGLAYFDSAVRADAANALSRQWYAAALQSVGRYGEALRQIDAAQRLDATSRSIRVSKAIILLAKGDIDAAEAILKQLVAHEPGYRSPYRFLALAALARQDTGAYLSAWRERFNLTGDPIGSRIIEAGQSAYLEHGDTAMARAMARKAGEQAADVEPYFLAHVQALAGETESAARQLASIDTRHAFYYGFDPAFRMARRDPAFVEKIRAARLPVLP